MKCDELEQVEYPIEFGSYYKKDEVDAAIAELKAKVKFCSDFEFAARKDIEEMRGQHQMLKQFGHYKLSPVPGKMINHEVRQYVSYNVVCMIINHLEAENKRLKDENESLKYSVATLDTEIAMMKRWRKFSEEKPEHHQWILVFYPNHSQFTTGVELRRWDDGCKFDVEVQEVYDKWMPSPEPPEVK